MEQQAASEDARFRSFNGMTMAQFMATTLVTPSDYFETGSDRRVYVADKRAPDPRFGCTMHIETIKNGSSPNANGWTITSIRRQGGCAGV